MSRTFYLPKDFEGKSVYLNKTEMFLLHSALKKIDLEKTNEIYWNDIRNLCEKIKPVRWKEVQSMEICNGDCNVCKQVVCETAQENADKDENADDLKGEDVK
jgi:hypothetical protein